MGIGAIGTKDWTYQATYRVSEASTDEGIAMQAAEALQAKGQATAVLHGTDEGSGDIAVFSSADVVNGVSISAYKTADFDSENTVYKVKIWDQSGNVTERMVDVSEVDLTNCDTVELYAYAANLKESGKGSFEYTVLNAVIAKAVKNAEQKNSASWSYSEKTDWIEVVKELMQSAYSCGDMNGYMEWNKFLELLDRV